VKVCVMGRSMGVRLSWIYEPRQPRVGSCQDGLVAPLFFLAACSKKLSASTVSGCQYEGMKASFWLHRIDEKVETIVLGTAHKEVA